MHALRLYIGTFRILAKLKFWQFSAYKRATKWHYYVSKPTNHQPNQPPDANLLGALLVWTLSEVHMLPLLVGGRMFWPLLTKCMHCPWPLQTEQNFLSLSSFHLVLWIWDLPRVLLLDVLGVPVYTFHEIFFVISLSSSVWIFSGKWSWDWNQQRIWFWCRIQRSSLEFAMASGVYMHYLLPGHMSLNLAWLGYPATAGLAWLMHFIASYVFE